MIAATCVLCKLELLPAYLALPIQGQPNMHRPLEEVAVPRARAYEMRLSWCSKCCLLYAVPK